MNAILEALAGAELWQIVLAILVAVAGSSAASAWITGGFEARRASKSFKREVRAAALEAAGDAYSTYLRYGNSIDPPVFDEERDQNLAVATATVQARVGAIGDTALLELVGAFVDKGELFAAQNEDTSVQAVNEEFAKVVYEISRSIPAK